MRKHTKAAYDAWCESRAAYPDASIWTSGADIFSYDTALLAGRPYELPVLNVTRYTAATTLAQGALRDLLREDGLTWLEVEDQPRGVTARALERANSALARSAGSEEPDARRQTLAEKLSPERLRLSPTFRSILAYMLETNERQRTGPKLTSLVVTSDGYLAGSMTERSCMFERWQVFFGTRQDLIDNINALARAAGLSEQEEQYLLSQVPLPMVSRRARVPNPLAGGVEDGSRLPGRNGRLQEDDGL